MSETKLPPYLTSATPTLAEDRAPWYKNTAPTYAGIFLWFVFWQDAVNSGTPGGGLAQGIGVAIIGLLIAALLCHFLFYLVPGMLGMKTGLPLYIVGTSSFGAQGGFLMPAFLMGILQFGFLAVNVYFSSLLLHETLSFVPVEAIMVLWGLLAAFMGVKGIQYVAKVATFLPLIPLGILVYLLINTIGGVGSFDPETLTTGSTVMSMGSGAEPLGTLGVIAFSITYVVGFFATAGAAGVDFGTSSRDAKDVKWGGLIGISLAIVITACAAALIVAGIYGDKEMAAKAMAASTAADGGLIMQVPKLMGVVVGEGAAKTLMFLLALAAFPAACFSSFIGANSFKSTMPQVNPFVSVGAGAYASIILAVTGLAGKVLSFFVIIGASFGPICGIMVADYLLSGRKWNGPRAGFNPAGWIAWALGFAVGIAPNTGFNIPAAPLLAFLVGGVVYFLCAKLGLLSKTIDLTGDIEPSDQIPLRPISGVLALIGIGFVVASIVQLNSLKSQLTSISGGSDNTAMAMLLFGIPLSIAGIWMLLLPTKEK
jgi:cytosine permease